ncbi:hypothetical protein ABN028_15205 [Actinopolymorpha sp. B17G11]|uniref:hypothetical protein n=1 Tax=unclassified Actinopolymorpha TaxID=2627063 RepID=UPI0032D8CAF3
MTAGSTAAGGDPAGRRVGGGVVRLAGVACGLAMVGVLVAALPSGLDRWIGGGAALAVALSGLGGGFGAYVPWGLVVVTIGVTTAADAVQLPVLSATAIGLLAVAYLVLLEGADALDGASAPLDVAMLAGWVRSLTPVLGPALAGALVVMGVVLLPHPPAAWLVVAAPLALMVGVALALRRPSR